MGFCRPFFLFLRETFKIMEYVWIALAIICGVVGLIGAVVPVIPGSIISYAALWLMWLSNNSYVSSASLWIMGALMVAVCVFDYIAPIWMTKLGGGSKQSMWGATIGLLIGFIFAPIGLIIGPFLGALVGELTTDASLGQALKIATLSFLAFILTTGLKLIYGVAIIVMIIMVLWN